MGFTWCCFSSTSPKEVGCLDEAQAKLSQRVIHCQEGTTVSEESCAYSRTGSGWSLQLISHHRSHSFIARLHFTM